MGEPPADGLEVLCSVYPAYLLAKEVTAGVPGVNVDLLLAEDSGCPHHYRLTPGDLRRLARAKVLVVNGAGFEEFLEGAKEKANPSLRIVEASAGLERIPGKGQPGEGHGPGENPHTWVSPRNAAAMAKTIAEALAGLHPAGAEAFRRNAGAFAGDCGRLAADWRSAAARLRSKRFAAAHEVFDYLARDAGFEVPVVLRSSEGEAPSPGRLARTIRAIREQGIGAILSEPQFPADLADLVARETGLPVLVLDPLAAGPRDARYGDVMRANLEKFRSLEK
jgi:zinc transport system substrate-binding protein